MTTHCNFKMELLFLNNLDCSADSKNLFLRVIINATLKNKHLHGQVKQKTDKRRTCTCRTLIRRVHTFGALRVHISPKCPVFSSKLFLDKLRVLFGEILRISMQSSLKIGPKTKRQDLLFKNGGYTTVEKAHHLIRSGQRSSTDTRPRFPPTLLWPPAESCDRNCIICRIFRSAICTNHTFSLVLYLVAGKLMCRVG